MFLAAFCGMALIEELDKANLLIGLLTSGVILVFYVGVLIVTGFARRSVQVLTCVIGCGALLTMLSIAEFVLFRSFVGQALAGTVGVLIGFWSIPVEGHILARAIGQHWFVGIAIAVVAAILQFTLQAMISEPGST
jgi:hypothetical protein